MSNAYAANDWMLMYSVTELLLPRSTTRQNSNPSLQTMLPTCCDAMATRYRYQKGASSTTTPLAPIRGRTDDDHLRKSKRESQRDIVLLLSEPLKWTHRQAEKKYECSSDQAIDAEIGKGYYVHRPRRPNKNFARNLSCAPIL